MQPSLPFIVSLAILCLLASANGAVEPVLRAFAKGRPAAGASGVTAFREGGSTAVSRQTGQTNDQNPAGSAEASKPEEPRNQPTFRVGTSDVQAGVDVAQSGRPITVLTANDFELQDEGKPQAILYFAHDSEPLDIVLLLDVSGSVRKYLPDMASISRAALSKLLPHDRVAVMTFSRDTWIEQSFTEDRNEISAAIEKASRDEPPGSGTKINAAIRSAARYLGSQNPGALRRRAILIVTDNSGMSYDVHQEQALRSLYDANITLDALVVGRHPHPPEPRPGSVINPDFAFDDVFPLAGQTGGEAIPTTKPKTSLGEMLSRIRDRYALVYHMPSSAVPGSFRRIHIDLSPEARKRFPRSIVSARAGYYVNGSQVPEGTRP
jgi:VWFA-related protein